jgi:hypothetical protein
MQSTNFDEFIEKLKTAGYEIKEGKYLAVKPKRGKQFIRLKSLGEDYYEQALKNRLTSKNKFESNLKNKIKPDNTFETTINKTAYQYTQVFRKGALPVKRKNPKKYFSWTNDSELDKLAELTRKINRGEFSLDKLRGDFSIAEKNINTAEKKIETLKNELRLFDMLVRKAKYCFETPNTAGTHDYVMGMELLNKHKITRENYFKVAELSQQNSREISLLEKNLNSDKEKFYELAETLTTCEKIFGGMYVQVLVQKEIERKQAEYISNDVKRKI